GADRCPSVPQASPSGRDRPSHQEGSGGMTLILLQAIIQSIASTLYWIGLYVGIPALPGGKSRPLRWTVGSAAVLVVWLVGVMLLAANDVFRTDAPRIPVALLTTLAVGYLSSLPDVPRHHQRHPAALADRHPNVPDPRRRVPRPIFPR